MSFEEKVDALIDIAESTRYYKDQRAPFRQALLDEHRNLREELAFRRQELTEVRELYHVRVERYGSLEKQRDELKAAIRDMEHGDMCAFRGNCTPENCIWTRCQ